MKSKTQVIEEQARREAIESQRQGESKMVIGGHIPKTDYDSTLKWLTERNRRGAENKMSFARWLDGRTPLAPVPGMEPPKRAPHVEPSKPAEIGDVVEDRGYLNGKLVQRIKRIVGV